MADYEHICYDCKLEWEASYSINADPPKECPTCKSANVQRLISLGGKGVVELTGRDLVSKVKEDTAKLKRDMHGSEAIYSNMVGESKYQSIQQTIDKQKRDRGRR